MPSGHTMRYVTFLEAVTQLQSYCDLMFESQLCVKLDRCSDADSQKKKDLAWSAPSMTADYLVARTRTFAKLSLR